MRPSTYWVTVSRFSCNSLRRKNFCPPSRDVCVKSRIGHYCLLPMLILPLTLRIANLISLNVVVWPKLFERRRRVVLGSSMMAINGRIQQEGEVVHLIAQQLFDLSGDLSALAGRDGELKLPSGRGDEFAHGWPGSPDSRDRVPRSSRGIFSSRWTNPLRCRGAG
jgi:hypothetical protein